MQTESHTQISGEGVIENGEIKSVGEIVGPYGIDIAWKPESTDQERFAAQPFITEAMQTLNENPDALPSAVESMTVRRV